MVSAARFISILSLLFLSVLPVIGCSVDSGSDSSDDFENVVIREPISTDSNTVLQRAVRFCDTEDPDTDTTAELSSLFTQFVASSGVPSGRLAKRLLETDSIATIPVQFHVISKGDTFEDGQVPAEMLVEQIDVLNRAYSGEMGGVATPFRFELNGINRVRNEEWHVMYPGSPSEVDAKPSLKVGGADVLNVFLVDIQTPEQQEGIILGYSTLPVLYRILSSFDGIVMNFRGLPGGPLEHYSTGNVLVHEVGHWLGLFHTFLGECNEFYNDLIPDTPRELIPSAGDFCPLERDSCPNLEGKDPIHNHMTYTADSCRFEFTEGQVDFMVFNALVFRQMSDLVFEF